MEKTLIDQLKSRQSRETYQMNQNHQSQKNQQNIMSSQESPNFFNQYLQILKSKILKRKIILFLLNILLTISALIFAICFLIWGNHSDQSQNDIKINQIFNTDFSLLTLFLIGAIGLLSAIFAVIIIKGKVLMLHCYWIACLVFLIIFSFVCASAFALTSMNCEEPSSYILQKIKATADLASSLFCTETCPCNRSKYRWAANATIADRVQVCPGWEEIIYSSFLSTTQQSLKCSGWCQINQKSYFTFSDKVQLPDSALQKNCFDVIRMKIEYETSYLRIFSIILCFMLVLIIFYTNYYIFMQKQDETRQVKKMQKRMKETQQIMEQELKTSQRMIS